MAEPLCVAAYIVRAAKHNCFDPYDRAHKHNPKQGGYLIAQMEVA